MFVITGCATRPDGVRCIVQTCGRCSNGVIAQPAVPITNAGPDLDKSYSYDYQWRTGRATNYGEDSTLSIEVEIRKFICLAMH